MTIGPTLISLLGVPALAGPRRPGPGRPGQASTRTSIQVAESLIADQRPFVLAALADESRAAIRSGELAELATTALGEVGQMLDGADVIVSAVELGTSHATDGQARIDAIVRRLDAIATATAFDGRLVFDGNARVEAAERTLVLESLSTSALGVIDHDGRRLVLADVTTGRPLNLVDGDRRGALASIGCSSIQVVSMREQLAAFASTALIDRLTGIGLAVAGVTGSPAGPGDRGAAMLEARAIRDQFTATPPPAARHRRENVLPLLT